ncbi:MAG: sulfatase-like hydrolase/transferase, partial [Flavicella sp.]
MNNFLFLRCFIILSFSLNAQSNAPNILFIMSDDHSAATIGVYASTLKEYVHTPNIDRIAKEGAIFNNVHCVNALCAPSRATILTGKYSHKSGVYTLREELNTKEATATVPKLLQKQGYQTAVFGKWHIHGDNLYGFDDYAITTAQGSYWNPSFQTPLGKKLKTKGYATDVHTQLSIDWLQKRDKDKPFYLMTHYKAAHAPWEYAKRHATLFEKDTLPYPKTLNDSFADRAVGGVAHHQSRLHNPQNLKMSLSTWFQKGKKGVSGTWPTGNITINTTSNDQILRATYQKYIKDYLRVVAGIDEGVGRLLEYLEAEGILDNTVIIYTSDQGMFLGEHGFFDKRLGLNEATKMPFLMRFPKQIKAGTKVQKLINNVDFAETLVDIAGASIPKEMQGHSFWQLAQHPQDNNWL